MSFILVRTSWSSSSVLIHVHFIKKNLGECRLWTQIVVWLFDAVVVRSQHHHC